MRIWGKVPTAPQGGIETLAEGDAYQWVAVETDATGSNDYVYLTALVQCLKLNLGESPFYGNFGLPARASVQQQVPPDYAVAFTQSFYAPFFASLIVTKSTAAYPPTPTYGLQIIRNNGSTFQAEMAL